MRLILSAVKLTDLKMPRFTYAGHDLDVHCQLRRRATDTTTLELYLGLK